MDNDILVNIEGLSKKYSKNLKQSLLYGVKDILRELIGKPSLPILRDSEFWALNDVNLKVRRGEILGIIGSNGSGKTTLLKVINGLLKPDIGKVEVRGKVGALIALGAGFSPILSGRENIYINGAVLGLSKANIDSIIDAIIDYAGVRDYIDMPVQNYSSGMRVKLGFSIAINLKPDLLLVDEVLAVGDYAFREKSFNRMVELCKSGVGVIFISHNMSAILTICNRVLWIEKGNYKMIGNPNDIVQAYLKNQNQKVIDESIKDTEGISKIDRQKLKSGKLEILDIELFNVNKILKSEFNTGDTIIIRVHYEAKTQLNNPKFCIDVCQDNKTIFCADMLQDKVESGIMNGKGTIDCTFKNINLQSGLYYVNVNAFGKTQIIKLVKSSTRKYFTIRENTDDALSLTRGQGLINIPYIWKINKL